MDTIQKIIIEFKKIFEPLFDSIAIDPFPNGIVELASQAGIRLEDYKNYNTHLDLFRSEMYGIFNSFHEELSLTNTAEILSTIKSVIDNLESFDSLEYIPEGNAPVEKLCKGIVNYLLIEYLKKYKRHIYTVLLNLGLIYTEHTNDLFIEQLDLHRIIEVLTHPELLPERLYDWGIEFSVASLFNNIEKLFRSFKIPAIVSYAIEEDYGNLIVNSGHFQDSLNSTLKIPFLQYDKENGKTQAGLELLPQVFDGYQQGLAIVPFGDLFLTQKIDLDSGWICHTNFYSDLSVPIGFVLRPGNIVICPIQGDPVMPNIRFRAITEKKLSHKRVEIFSASNLLNIDIGKLSTLIEFEYGNKKTFTSGFYLHDCNISIDLSDGDSFISQIIPTKKAELRFDLEVGWSSENGLYMRGSSGLEVTIPLNQRIGPINWDSLYLYLAAVDSVIKNKVCTSFSLKMGPLSVTIRRLGLKTVFSFPDDVKGNMGPANLDFAFLHPSGAGLALNAGPITGGGYLDFDKDNQRYAGTLSLKFGEIGLTAIGLITTQMPDGSDGYSLLINIGVTFHPSIQLSFGFSLAGVGGLIGIHRTMLTDVLRERIEIGSVGSILFPEDPIANANQIISDLQSVLPPTEDRYVIGPMFKIGWGAKNMVSADIGLFIELPEPKRVVVLGQISARLPIPNSSNRDNEKIVLNIDVLGIVDFEKETLAIDAILHKSRLLEYPLNGDAAVRLSWGNDPYLALSLGGFHPKFSPPPNFPSLRRLTLDISKDKDLQITCRAYLALTSNTLQFGASISLYADYKATLEGGLKFNALIYFNPFAFTADMSGNVSVKYKGRKLCGINISLKLSGPSPWHARGKVSFEIVRWDVSVSFNETWGSSKQPQLPTVNAWKRLQAALKRPESWAGRLPEQLDMVECLTDLNESLSDEEVATGADLVVHPAGRLEITQAVLPLGIQLERLGNSPIDGPSFFDIESVSVNGQTIDDGWVLTPVEDFFARGHYKNLSKNARLTKPSFEKMKAGVAVGEDKVDFVEPIPKTLTFESVLIDKDRVAKNPEGNNKNNATLSWEVAGVQVKRSAAGWAGTRNTGKRKFDTPGQEKTVTRLKECFAIVTAKDMNLVSESDIPNNKKGFSRMEAEDILGNYRGKNQDAEPVQIVRRYEVAA